MGKIQYYANRNLSELTPGETPKAPNPAPKREQNRAQTDPDDIPWQKKEYLLFDLDGTLTDPGLGITSCVQYALESFGIQENDREKLNLFIGPPLADSFMQFYGFTKEQADQAVAKYRERFSEKGLYENEIYRGIPDMLHKLKSRGIRLGVASSKPTVYVEKILEHFKIRDSFEVVVGSELDGTRSQKAEVVLEALHRFFPNGRMEKEKVYMIGDRKFDVEGAKTMGIESVGVSYGYGSTQELMEAHADYIVRSVEELRRFLLRGYEDMNKDLTGFQKVWILMFHFVIFAAVKGLAINLGKLFLISNGVETLTADQSTILSMIGYAAGAAAIWKGATSCIKRTISDMYLTHLKAEPKVHYWMMVPVSAGLSLGAYLLLTLTGISGASEGFARVSEVQGGTSVIPAILCYCLISPVAEELLFRGIIYGYLRKFFDIRLAIVASSILFGVYHGNMVQAAYGAAMGYLISYAYEYFGSFKVPVFMHMGMNLLALAIGYLGFTQTAFVSWPSCIILLLIGIVPAVLLVRKKRIM